MRARRARDLFELLGHLGGEPAVVVGWSLGMQEALVCAHEFGTERIRALVLVDHPVVLDKSLLGILGERIESLQVNREAWTREFIKDILRKPPSETYLEELIQAALAMPTNAAAIMMANLYFVGPTDLSPALDALDRPVLFIYSSLDWAVAAAEYVRKGWPKVPVRVIDNPSHVIFVAETQEFNRVVEQFVGSLPK